jgi:hypothetical protein
MVQRKPETRWKIVQVWESADYARHYDDEILRPALEAVNAPMDAEIAVV